MNNAACKPPFPLINGGDQVDKHVQANEINTNPLASNPPCSEVGIQSETFDLFLAPCGSHDACFLVLADPLLEEIRLALQGDQLHPIERVRCAKEFRVAQRREH